MAMPSLHRCNVCHEEIARGEGEPCMNCGAWFHYAERQPELRRCGVNACEVPALDA
jgi:hypothetical protein